MSYSQPDTRKPRSNIMKFFGVTLSTSVSEGSRVHGKDRRRLDQVASSTSDRALQPSYLTRLVCRRVTAAAP